MKKLKQETIDSIIDDLKNTSLTQQEIAEKYNITKGMITYYKRIYNVERPTACKTNYKIMPEIIDSIIDDLENTTLTQQEIANKYSITQGAVEYYKRKYDIERINSRIKEKIIYDLENTNLTQQEIAEKYSIVQSAVAYYKKKYDIERATACGTNYKLTAETIDSIISDLENSSLTQPEIAEKYSIDQSAVAYYKKKYNIERPSSYGSSRKLASETIDSIIDDLKNTTLTQQEIANKYSISQGMISYYNKIYNVERLNFSYKASHKLTAETIDSIIDDLKNTTLSQQEIAKKYSISQGTVSYYKKILDSSSYEPKSRISPEIKEAIIDDLKNSSLTQPEIAEKYNVSQTTVLKYKRKFNIKRPTGYSPKSKISPEVKFNILNALKYSNMSLQEIADKFHVHVTTVEHCKNNYSIKRPSSYDPTRRLAPEIRFKVINDLKYSNMTLQEIADKYSINISTVMRIKKKYNIKRSMK